ncbi:MAG: hypothetical protein ACR2O8_12040 [Rhizobiaceae bacterium]
MRISKQRRRELKEQHWSWLNMIMMQTGFGMAIGALVGFLIIHHDIRRIGTMIEKSQYAFGFTFLLLFSFATLCGMVAAGAAIWLRAEQEHRDG